MEKLLIEACVNLLEEKSSNQELSQMEKAELLGMRLAYSLANDADTTAPNYWKV